MARNDQHIRFMAIIRKLESPQGLYPPSMATESGVTRRTIYRDLAAVEGAGYPVWQDDAGGRTVWRLDPGYRTGLRDLSVTHGEMLALWYAVSVALRHPPAPFADDIRTLIRKVETLGGNGNGFREAARRFFRPLIRGEKKGDGIRAALAAMTEALIRRRVVEVAYRAPQARALRNLRIHPHHLFEYRNGLYVSCFSESHGKGITLALERMAEVAVTDAAFELRPDLDPARAHAHSIGLGFGPPVRVVLRFAREVAPYVRERIWHATQKIKERSHGSVELTMDVCVDHELLGMIGAYGPAVNVLRPASLRSAVRDRLAAALAHYP
jgi:predicted DNA-binding transcriptional regulator YafY